MAEILRQISSLLSVDKDVEIWTPIEDKPWGMRKFSIVTIDGHRILFSEEIS